MIISACALSPRDMSVGYLENPQFVQTIGGKKTSEKSIAFVYRRQNEKERRIVVHVEDIPVEMRFKLCDSNEVLADSNITVVGQSSPDCRSWLTITPLPNHKYALSYELNLLLGYEKQRHQGQVIYTPVTKKLAQYKAVYPAKSVSTPLTRYSNSTIVESTEVKVNL
ncbi:hypothetical protein ACODM8_09335 [Vibrio ostreicida]|uniref:hypothetical protein n=1 Tax=Vibrio ostreicida TaxID=526588 RepID=UPI003B5A60FA